MPCGTPGVFEIGRRYAWGGVRTVTHRSDRRAMSYPVIEEHRLDTLNHSVCSPRSLRPPLPRIAETSSTSQTNGHVEDDSDLNPDYRLNRPSSDVALGQSLPSGVVVEIFPARRWQSRCCAMLSWNQQNSQLWVLFLACMGIGYFLGFLTMAITFRFVK